METAAAILTHLLYTSNAFGPTLESDALLVGSADTMVESVRKHYEAMLKMVREVSAKR
jgi:hypothetical protein